MPSSSNHRSPRFSRPRRTTRRQSAHPADSLLSGLETVDQDNPEVAATEEEDALESTIGGLTRLGNYMIERTLGVGAMGQVFLAREKTLDRRVALKVLKSTLNKNEAFARRFLVEARAAAALDHPNIVRVYRVGKDRETGRLFMAMEYVEGKDLDSYLARGAPSFNSILRIAMGVANALEHAREKRLLHRDVKPKNIMLGGKKRVLLLDFGLAKFSDEGKKAITRSGMILGSPDYMSPEQFQGGDLDHRSDLYSLGVVMYQMLAGTKPFKGSSVPDMLHLHRYAYPRQISAHRKNVPRAFEQVLERLLAKNPENRYKSPRELYKDLKQLRRELDRQGKLDDRPEGPALQPVTVKDSGNFDDGDILDVRSTRTGVPITATPASRSRMIAWFLVTLVLVGLATAGVTAWTQARPAADPAQLLARVTWSAPMPAWTGSAGLWREQGNAAWAHEAAPEAGTIALTGKGYLGRAAGGTIWRVEGCLLDGGAQGAGLFVEANGAPFVGLRFRKLAAGTIQTFEVWHEDTDGVGLAALVIDSVAIGPEGLPVMVSVVEGYAIFEVGGKVIGRRTLPERATRFSLAVDAHESACSVWRDLSLRLGKTTDSP